jgi:transcriptional regulator with GAF, ATPase, and Fis domain
MLRRWSGQQRRGEVGRTDAERARRSVIGLPVKLDSETLGVVSVDSEAPHHFSSCVPELATEIAPFVQLLAASLPEEN